uniref:Uncharacterized protein n=2 Tax=Ciona intestinalis TaxID=7719 RepID=H2Y2R0_CIOIN
KHFPQKLKSKTDGETPQTDAEASQCDNLLENIVKGQWVVYNKSLEREIDDVYTRYRSQRKIQNKWTREDGKCGYNNYQDRIPGSNWPRVGSWCDRYGNKPCCDNYMNGVCRDASEETCNCPNCIDTRKYKVAEAAIWKTDGNCKWTNYSGDTACDVIENSQFNDLQFVGDSHMRNMFVGMMMLLSNDPNQGAWSTHTTPEQKKRCHGFEFFFWDNCRTVIEDMYELPHYNKLCRNRTPKFSAAVKVYFSLEYAGKFVDLVKQRLGKIGTLIVVGVGLHINLNPTATIDRYLKPAVDVIEKHYANSSAMKWPKLVWVLPLPANLLKPTQNIKSQGKEGLDAFSSKLNEYCKEHGIPVMDFGKMAQFTQSFDGFHYGLAVNLMLNQILLNYISSISP